MSSQPIVLHLRSTGEVLGAESVLLEMVSQGDPDRYRQVVGVLHDHRDPFPPLAQQLDELGHEVRVFKCHRRIDVSVIREIAGFIRELPASIVHCHGYREDLYGYLASRGSKPLLVATNHNWLRSNFMLRFYAWLDGRVLRRFDHAVGVSAPVIAELRAAGIAENRSSLIANGVATGRFGTSPSPTRNTSAIKMFAHKRQPLLGVVASLTPEKGHAVLLSAVSKLVADFPDVGVLLIGDGPLRPALAQQVEALGLAEHVCFAGTRRDVDELLHDLDIFVLPSTREGLPMALLEAMAAARAIVATTVGDISVALDHGSAGVLVPPGDPDALAQALGKLAANDDEQRRLGEAARAVVVERYSSNKMAARYMALYDHLLKTRHG